MRTPQPAVTPRALRVARRAFTLIELLVVMIIIAVLISIIVPVLGSVRVAARKGGTQALMTNIVQAAQKFQNDERRLPGVFDPASMGNQENDQSDVGMSGAENALLDMIGIKKQAANQPLPPGENAIDWITVGPFSGAANPKNLLVKISLLGVEEEGTKNYFIPDAKHLVAQEAGVSQIGGLGNTAASGQKQLPDIVDDFGQPILFWARDDSYLHKPGPLASGYKFASQYSGPPGSTGYPTTNAMYYWASNACFLKSAALGRKGRDQTDANAGSWLSSTQAANLPKHMMAFFGNPAYPYRPFNPGPSFFPDVPAAGRGALILQSAGPDGVYFGIKDKGSGQFADAATSTMNVNYKYSFTTNGTDPQLDRNGQQTTHDVNGEFDDLTASGGN